MSAALHILQQMRRDPRLAYLIGPGSQSFELLTEEVAAAQGKEVESFRREFALNLKTERWPSEYDIQCRIEDAVAKAGEVPA
jgi:hypothetical protein